MEPGVVLDFETEYKAWLAQLEGKLGRLDNNFLRVQLHAPGSWTDDGAWAQAAANWGVLAQMSKRAGFEGIWFDNENYDGAWNEGLLTWNEGDPQDADTTRSLAYQRGQQLMQAVVDADPEAKVMFATSPAEGARIPDEEVLAGLTMYDFASELELVVPFFSGFLARTERPGQLIDGGELYRLRSQEQFADTLDWRRQGIVNDPEASKAIPEEQRGRWSELIGLAFGQYNQPWDGLEMNPEIYRSSVGNALKTTDEYVWAYGEKDNWFVPGGMPDEWKVALEGARKDAQLPEPAIDAAEPVEDAAEPDSTAVECTTE